MGNFRSFQRQKRGSSTAPSPSSAQPARPFAPSPQPASPDGEPQHTYAHQPGHSPQWSFAHIPLFPEPAKKNRTNLPDTLKAGVEQLSGLSMDDVHVHHNSARPAQLQAYAYTQGAEIHVGPGQERHLPHELWHVVQQKQGRVQPTMQMKSITINGDQGLEHEADMMGRKALHYQEIPESSWTSHDAETPVNTSTVIQRAKITEPITGSTKPGELTYTEEGALQLSGQNAGKKVAGIILVLVEVPPTSRGRGVGETLVQRFLTLVGNRQCYLEVSPLPDEQRTTEQLTAWYERRGFVDTGLKGVGGEPILTNNMQGVVIEDIGTSAQQDEESSSDDEGQSPPALASLQQYESSSSDDEGQSSSALASLRQYGGSNSDDEREKPPKKRKS